MAQVTVRARRCQWVSPRGPGGGAEGAWRGWRAGDVSRCHSWRVIGRWHLRGQGSGVRGRGPGTATPAARKSRVESARGGPELRVDSNGRRRREGVGALGARGVALGRRGPVWYGCSIIKVTRGGCGPPSFARRVTHIKQRVNYTYGKQKCFAGREEGGRGLLRQGHERGWWRRLARRAGRGGDGRPGGAGSALTMGLSAEVGSSASGQWLPTSLWLSCRW